MSEHARQDPVRFVLYECNNDNAPKQVELSLRDFFVFLGEHDEGPKDGDAWGPGWIPPGKKRRGASVESFDVMGFDLDHVSAEQFAGTRANISSLEHLCHSTYSHNAEKNNFSARVIFSLSRRVMASEYRTLWDAVVRTYGFSPDKKARDPSRLFFTPRCPKGAPRFNIYNPGAPLDVDALLLSELGRKQSQHLEIEQRPPAPVASDPGAVDSNELRRALMRYTPADDHDGEKKALLRRVLAGEKLSDKPGRGDVGHGRGSAAVQLGGLLGWALPLGTPPEAVEQLVRDSIAATPRYEDDTDSSDTPEVCLEKILKHYEEAAARKLEKKESEGNIIAWAVAHAKSTDQLPPNPAVAPDVVSTQLPSEAESTPDGSWKLLMHWNEKTGMPLATTSNVEIVLRHHPAWKGVLRFNELTKDVSCLGGTLHPKHCSPERLAPAVQNWLQYKQNQLCIALPLRVVEEQLLHVARDNSYNPVANYLLSLQWDGIPRIDTFFEACCHAHVTENGADISEYVHKVSARWFMGAVRRGLTPGCKMDNVLVLEGLEGLKKSQLFEVLGGEFFSYLRTALDTKDSKMLCNRTWIVELAELQSVKHTEVEVQKGFLSARFDDFRLPYGRVVERFPRPCVYVGTTNDEEYLKSVTGNRRFWVLHCEKKVDLDEVRVIRDQLWAEAVFRTMARGESYWFEPEEYEQFSEITEARVTDSDSMTMAINAIVDWFTRVEPKDRPSTFTMNDVLSMAFRFDAAQIANLGSGAVVQRVGRALTKRLGCEKYKQRIGKSFVWKYKTSAELMELPKANVSKNGLMRLVVSNATPESTEPPPPEAPEDRPNA